MLRELRIIENDIGALAAELLAHALYGGRRVLGDVHTGARRARERDQVDIGMAGERRADARTIALDEIEHAGRHIRGMHDLGENMGGERRNFGGLEHHGAAGRERGEHLDGDLVHRPVPRRDQTADADGLFHDHRRAARLLEAEILQHFDGGVQMRGPQPHLKAIGERFRRSHLFGDRRAEVADALLVLPENALQYLEALLAARQ